MKFQICRSDSSLAALVLPAVAAPAPAADIAAGKALAEGCAACHGADGVSQMPLTPSLAGEPDDFTQWQLVYFRSGARKSEVMGPIGEALSNPDIRNLGAYYASLAPPKPAAAIGASDALAQTGRKARRAAPLQVVSFRRLFGPPGGRATRQPARGRPLKALRDFKAGARPSSGVASMSEVTYELSDSDMQALAHYLSLQR